MNSADDMLVLDRPSVERCLSAIDPVDVVERTARAHARGLTRLPAEGYLAWTNGHGAYSRSLAMLGAVADSVEPVYGIKVVNAATSNPDMGIERAGGLLMLFDPETARPRLLAEAAVISALRTAAYTMLSVRHVGPEQPDVVSVLGCGALARMHLRLFAQYFPGITRAVVFDTVPGRAQALRDWAADGGAPSIAVAVAQDALSCVAASDLLVTTTVSSKPYIDASWFARPAFIAHVSLDDVNEDVLRTAQALYVDDVDLVVDNPRRVLGAVIAAGGLAKARGADGPGLDGTLGDVLEGRVPAIRPSTGHVVSNPFGMAILDVAIGAAVEQVALKTGEGSRMNLVQGMGRDHG